MVLLVESCAGAVFENSSGVEKSITWVLGVTCPFVADKPAAQVVALGTSWFIAQPAEGCLVIDADFQSIVVEASTRICTALRSVTFSDSLRVNLCWGGIVVGEGF